MAFGYYIEAEYESGYIHREDEQDQSPFVRGKNILHDIVNHYPEKAHGKLVRFSLISTSGKSYDIDFKSLPKNAKPIYYRQMQLERNLETGRQNLSCLKHYFGYEYKNNKEKVKEIQEI
ncbi:MAG TPA: hypothetical protein PLO25_01425 [Candidatus Saccharibacteria bacterium]|nr:hypothetical protein [Candidatus Saccharibacteria bacterium]